MIRSIFSSIRGFFAGIFRSVEAEGQAIVADFEAANQRAKAFIASQEERAAALEDAAVAFMKDREKTVLHISFVRSAVLQAASVIAAEHSSVSNEEHKV